MRDTVGRMAVRATGALAMIVALAAPALADEVLASRLGALLGQERQALQIVPSARMAALTSPPAAALRNVPTVPGQIAYDDAFLADLPPASGGAEFSCLAEALYFEARGESARGLFAVAEVIMNRVDSNLYPDSICAVVNQGTGRMYACQFTYTCDGNADTIRDNAAYMRVAKVARLMMDGAERGLTEGATHYHTTAVSPSWARRFPQTAQIGTHLFYRQGTLTASN